MIRSRQHIGGTMSTVNAQNQDIEIPKMVVTAGAAGTVWHVAIHGQKQGPMSREMLLTMMRAQQVAVDSLVWTPGMSQWQPATAFPEFAAALGVALRVLPNQGAMGDDDTVSTIIPHRNSAALIGYYIAIAGLIPVLGLILGPIAVFMGVKGERLRRANPSAHGSVHAWIAIVLGGMVTVLNLIGIPLGALAFRAASK